MKLKSNQEKLKYTKLDSLVMCTKKVSQITDYVNVNEAAHLLKVKPSTIYSWVHCRKIPFRKHGRILVFSRHELSEWSEAGSVKPLHR